MKNWIKRTATALWCFAMHFREERFWCIIHGEWRCPKCGTTWGD